MEHMATTIGPLISIRALREAHGLTTVELADRIAELGVPVHHSTLRNVELGHKPASARLMNAWALALGIKPADLRHGDDLRQYLLAQRQTEAA